MRELMEIQLYSVTGYTMEQCREAVGAHSVPMAPYVLESMLEEDESLGVQYGNLFHKERLHESFNPFEMDSNEIIYHFETIKLRPSRKYSAMDRVVILLATFMDEAYRKPIQEKMDSNNAAVNDLIERIGRGESPSDEEFDKVMKGVEENSRLFSELFK
jgi:hypothetical protein